MPSLFEDDFSYVKTAIDYLRQIVNIQAEIYPEEKRLDLTPNEELKLRLRFLPRDIRPDGETFILSADKKAIQNEIAHSRKEEKAWPRLHYLWELNPVVDWINDKLQTVFRRHEAPVLSLPDVLAPDETIFIISGLIPNRKSHPLVHRWFGVCFKNHQPAQVLPFEAVLEKTGLDAKTFPNPGKDIALDAVKALMPEVIEKAREWIGARRRAFEDEINAQLTEQLNALEQLRKKQHRQLELKFESINQPEKIALSRKDQKRRQIDKIFDDYLEWIEDTMTTEDNPYIQVVAVIVG